MLRALTCTLLLLSGCSFDLDRQPPDASTGDAPRDSLTPPDGHPVGESTLPADASTGDAPRDSLAPPDMRPPLPDLAVKPPDSQPAPDTQICSGSCCEAPSVKPMSTGCTDQCVSTADDPDCDGLAGAADPLTTCNPVLLVDDFREDPATSGTWSAVTTDWSCGAVTLKPGGKLTLANPLPPGAASYLVEARFTFGATADLASWRVTLHTGLTSGVVYNCELWIHPMYNPTVPSLHHNRNNACGNNGAMPPGTGSINNPPQGTYTLQLYHHNNKSVCRILDGANNLLQTSSAYVGCPGPTPDTFYMLAANTTVTVDYVRAYRIQ